MATSFDAKPQRSVSFFPYVTKSDPKQKQIRFKLRQRPSRAPFHPFDWLSAVPHRQPVARGCCFMVSLLRRGGPELSCCAPIRRRKNRLESACHPATKASNNNTGPPVTDVSNTRFGAPVTKAVTKHLGHQSQTSITKHGAARNKTVTNVWAADDNHVGPRDKTLWRPAQQAGQKAAQNARQKQQNMFLAGTSNKTRGTPTAAGRVNGQGAPTACGHCCSSGALLLFRPSVVFVPDVRLLLFQRACPRPRPATVAHDRPSRSAFACALLPD